MSCDPMNVLPCAAKRGYVLLKLPLHAGQINSGEAIVFSQRDRAKQTVKSKDGFMTLPSNMHMRGTMVIGINNNSQPAKPQNGWQWEEYNVKPKRLGFNMCDSFPQVSPVATGPREKSGQQANAPTHSSKTRLSLKPTPIAVFPRTKPDQSIVHGPDSRNVQPLNVQLQTITIAQFKLRRDHRKPCFQVMTRVP